MTLNFKGMKRTRINGSLWLLLISVLGAFASPALSQTPPIAPAADGTGTLVAPNGDRLDITGGSLSKDGANLFHSFQRFGLSQGQIANFLSNPAIRNILGRVTGGDASYINGLIQVTGGNSNLFLMNPAGIVFGPNASLNVPAAFTATTATGIGFNSGWFNAVGSNDYAALVGTPSAFTFSVAQPGAIANFGNLILEPGNNLTLLGGSVINTGTLSSPGGNITVAAVPGSSTVRISQEGHLLNLEIGQGAYGIGQSGAIAPLSLPQLLAGGTDFSHATGVSVSENGTVVLTGSGLQVPAEGGVAIASGTLNVAQQQAAGGSINILGSKVGVIGANINASGVGGGGTVRIGGDYRGLGSVPNATRTFVSSNSAINADAVNNGSGGRVIVWANDTTGFYGNISAKGGSNSGSGGFVEVSGKQNLIFRGNVDLSAPNGTVGTLLLDPENIIIVDGVGTDDFELGDGQILFGDRQGETFTISKAALEAMSGDVTLEAANDIAIDTGVSLNFSAYGGAIAFKADADNSGVGSFSMDATQSITAEGRNLSISGASITVGTISTSSNYAPGGSISLMATNGHLDAVSLNSSSFDADGGSVSLQASGDIRVDYIISSSNGGNGGNINFTSGGTIDTSRGLLDSRSGFNGGNGGAIALSASGNIYTGDVFSYSESGFAGDITISSTQGSVDTSAGTLDAYSPYGDGTISITSYSGSINAGSFNAAKNIAVSDGGTDDPFDGSHPDASATADANSINGASGNVILKAHNDITLNEAIATSSSSNLELIAGRTININADIDTSGGNGNITLRANNNSANSSYRDFGPGSVTMAAGTTLNAGSGNILVELGTLGTVGDVTLANLNTTGTLTVNATGGNILRASDTSLINAGSANFTTSGSGGIGTAVAPIRISVNNLEASAGSGGAFFESLKSVTLGGVTNGANGIAATGGNIAISAQGDITVAKPFSDTLSSNITLAATNNITFDIPNSASISFAEVGQYNPPGKLQFTADSDRDGSGSFTSNETIYARGRNVSIAGASINLLGSQTESVEYIQRNVSIFTGQQYGNGGTVTLEARNSINVENGIFTYSSAEGNAGQVNIRLTNPNGQANPNGAIDTDWIISANYWSGRAGDVTIDGNGGNVTTGFIRTEANEADTFELPLESGNITIKGGNVTTDYLTAGNGDLGEMYYGIGGKISVEADNNISITSLNSANGTQGGDITLISRNGSIAIGSIASRSPSGTAGDITVSASGNINITAPATASILSDGAKIGGNISLTSTTGTINLAGALNSYSANGTAGNISLSASGDITPKNIRSDGYSRGGNISITSTAGNINTSAGNLDSYSSNGTAGNVTLNAPGSITTSGIRSDGLLQGGNITITSNSVNGIDVQGNLATYSENGQAGNIILSSPGAISTRDITSYGQTESGNITVSSTSNNVSTNAIKTQSGSGPSGNININGKDVFTGNLDSIASTGSGNIQITAAGNITTKNISSTTDSGNSGNIETNAGGDTTTGDQTTSTGDGNSGNITNTSGGNTTTGNQTTTTGSGDSGNITNTSGGNTTTGNQTTTTGSGDSGNITNTAGGNITTGNQTTTTGSGDSGNIANTAGGNITTGNQTSSATNGNAGSITNTAANNIITGNQTSSATNGNAGSITNTAANNIITGNQTSSATNGNAGPILNTAGGNITTGNQTSSATNGNASSITNTAGGNITTGDQITIATNGNAGSIANTAGGNITTGSQISLAEGGNSGSITNTAGGNITTGDQITIATGGNSGNIANTAGGNITTGDQITIATGGNSGNITNTAGGNITTGNQISMAEGGNSGNITNTASGDITTGDLISSATGGNAGDITNTAGGNINTGDQISVSSDGFAGKISNTAGGEINTGDVVSGGGLGSGDISFNSGTGEIITGRVSTDGGQLTINGDIADTDTSDVLAGIAMPNNVITAAASETAIGPIDEMRVQEFSDYFGEDMPAKPVNVANVRAALSEVARVTGTQSAIVYVNALPDQLELILFTAEGQPIRKTIPDVKREQIVRLVEEFRDRITAPSQRRSKSYLQPAIQLYQWLIAPIESELQARAIDTLLFSMDAGLRGMPAAALHDGKQFLVEKYSLSLIPSISLIDISYKSLAGAKVLAMGASNFTELNPLPAVPMELSSITQQRQGQSLLNQSFTRDNLMSERSKYPYQIIHLATHGEFKPGDVGNSYIQLWDDKLRLNQLRQLRLNNPPVELLVLSACKTAVGDEKAELGFAGFAVQAGVKTALASLWYVSDEGTLGLMTEFYHHLNDAKIKAEALRQAQLDMIRGRVVVEGGELRGSGIRGSMALPPELAGVGKPNLSHPYYWAAFTMIGSPW